MLALPSTQRLAKKHTKTQHRIAEDYLTVLALKTGFRLDGVSEISANPDDSEDSNVYRLPPEWPGRTAVI